MAFFLPMLAGALIGFLAYLIASTREIERAKPTPGLPFDTKSLDFERGVGFGLMFARVKDYGRCEMAVPADMAEVVIRLAESRDLPFGGRPHKHGEHCAESIGCSDCKDGSEWLDVTIG